MGAGVVGQGAITVVFVALAVHSGWVAASASGRPARVLGALLHLIMAVDMAAMVWPWWHRLPVLPQLVLFGTGALGYAVAAGRQLSPRAAADPTGRRPWPPVLHAVMMTAMVWMVAVMAGSSAGAPTGHHHGDLAAPVVVLGTGLTGGLLIAGTGRLVSLLEVRRDAAGGNVAGIAAEVVMCLAMGAVCWLMLAGAGT